MSEVRRRSHFTVRVEKWLSHTRGLLATSSFCYGNTLKSKHTVLRSPSLLTIEIFAHCGRVQISCICTSRYQGVHLSINPREILLAGNIVRHHGRASNPCSAPDIHPKSRKLPHQPHPPINTSSLLPTESCHSQRAQHHNLIVLTPRIVSGLSRQIWGSTTLFRRLWRVSHPSMPAGDFLMLELVLIYPPSHSGM